MDEMLKRILACIGMKRGAQKDLADHLGINPNVITNWKNGSNKSYRGYSKEIAAFYGVSEKYILGETNEKNAPAETGRSISDSELKFALWGTTEITNEVLEDVRRFAKFAEEQERLEAQRKDDKRPE